jgi:hypothetical protein
MAERLNQRTREGGVRITVFRALEALTRRGLLAIVLGGAFLLVLGAPHGHAGVKEVANAAAWRLGDQLSLAALLYAQGGHEDKVEQLLSGLKPLAEAMQIEIKPFPPRAATSTATYADVIHYLIKEDGANIGREISGKFGNEAGTLFEVAVKSNLLILLYAPGDDQGIGGVIQSRCSEIGLPETLWIGLVTAINDKSSQGDVKDAVFKMHDDVATYLGEQAQ